ncbi:MAG: hypothetical protein E7258_03185 [Lachnospiraceae bacterium]|nr:hypothetical protein [Lachnospiraceae bacterium]
MISPIIATQTSAPIANVQQHAETQGALHNQTAQSKIQKNEQQAKETVVNKDEAVFYQQRHDAKEEGKNKYVNLYNNKKKKEKKDSETSNETTSTRVNFDIKI